MFLRAQIRWSYAIAKPAIGVSNCDEMRIVRDEMKKESEKCFDSPKWFHSIGANLRMTLEVPERDELATSDSSC